MNRYEQLKQLLGIDAEGATFRTSGMVVSERIAGLATDDAEALKRINSSGYVKRDLAADEVYLHTIEVASNRFIPDRFAFLGENTLANIAQDAVRGFAIITRHASGGGWFGGDGENPYGRTFAGVVDSKDGRKRTLVQFYMLRQHNPNGSAAPSTDDLDKGIVGGTLFDVSAGLTRGGTGRLLCDVCNLDLFTGCADHFPGSISNMTGEQIERQKQRGVPGGVATMTFDNFHAKETSFVVDGAVEGAGTALSTKPSIAPTRAQEDTVKYTNEFKLSIGLTAAATDQEVEARVADLSAKASRVDTLEAERKADRDRAFSAKVDGKLTPDEIAQIKDLANREALADMLLSARTTAPRSTPPIGNPLTGTAAAAAAPGQPQLSEFEQCSEEYRIAAGEFATKAELDKYASVSPLEALKKFFGMAEPKPRTDGAIPSTLRADTDFIKRDRRIVETRKRTFEIA